MDSPNTSAPSSAPQPPTPSPVSESSTHWTVLAVGLGALIALVIAAIVILPGLFASRDLAPSGPTIVIVDHIKAGNYEEALALYRTIEADPETGPNRLARALWRVAPARLKSPDPQEAIAAVADLKRVVADPGVMPELKARSITLLANAYNESGERDAVFEAVYNGSPYDALVRSSKARTFRATLEWSYSIYPTSRAAIGIALGYVREGFRVKFPPPGILDDPAEAITVEEAFDLTKQYLTSGDELLQMEIAEGATSLESTRYAAYLYWRAFVVGALAYFGEETYATQYRQAFEQFITYFEQNGDAESLQYLDFAYWNYAAFAMFIDNDEALAKELAGKLVQRVTNDPNPAYNEFILVMQNDIRPQLQEGQENFNTLSIEALSRISPEFKSLIEQLTTTSLSAAFN